MVLDDADNATGRHGADGDFDLDGVSNLGEYLAGTNPLVFEAEGFAIREITVGEGGSIVLTFPVVADRHYRVLYSDAFDGWAEAASFPILTSNPSFTWRDDGSITRTPPSGARKRFYSVEISPLSP